MVAASSWPPEQRPTVPTVSLPVICAHGVRGVHESLRVGVEVPVGVLGPGVAPARDEHLQPSAQGVLDEAAVLGEVEDVVPVDDGPDDQKGHGPHGGCRGGVLDDLHDLVAEHDLTGGGTDGLTDPERRGVHLARHPGVPQVAEQVAAAPHQAQAAGVEGVLEGGGVPDQGVRRGQPAGEDAGREAGALPGAPVDVGVLDGVTDRPLDRQVGLAEPAVEGMRDPRRVREAAVALGRSDRRAAQDGARRRPRRVRRRGGGCRGCARAPPGGRRRRRSPAVRLQGCRRGTWWSVRERGSGGGGSVRAPAVRWRPGRRPP